MPLSSIGPRNVIAPRQVCYVTVSETRRLESACSASRGRSSTQGHSTFSRDDVCVKAGCTIIVGELHIDELGINTSLNEGHSPVHHAHVAHITRQLDAPRLYEEQARLRVVGA